MSGSFKGKITKPQVRENINLLAIFSRYVIVLYIISKEIFRQTTYM